MTQAAAAASAGDRRAAKAHGVHYTPGALACFLAERVVLALGEVTSPSVLDPACGDGELLHAVKCIQPGSRLTGVDRDDESLIQAQRRLRQLGEATLDAWHSDFLEVARFAEDGCDGLRRESFDAIVSNPPYVRTQVLGAQRARELAVRFGLSGRVDLYQAFIRAMTPCLRPGGVLGLLCSNRFLTTLAGSAVRSFLRDEYELIEVFDLGDTKLFSAAVLPAVVIARRKEGRPGDPPCSYVRVYEAPPTDDVRVFDSIVAALADEAEGHVEVDGRTYEIERGSLAMGKTPKDPWTLTHGGRVAWLERIAERTAATFADVTDVKVGIKTTADSVFIRLGWDDLPSDEQPEPELIHPLITHHVADRWTPRHESKSARTVLYPHEVQANGRRGTVELDKFPNARRYLDRHRERLEGRAYVIAAGREWFEVWVAHHPADWAKLKIVFPDISDVPKFFLDDTGALVNGDCYWMAFEDDADPHLISLMLAVANSTLSVAFYDAVCGNRLYAGRRRFITQYVERFPIPDVDERTRARIHSLVEELRLTAPESTQRESLEKELDEEVWAAFGLLVGQTAI